MDCPHCGTNQHQVVHTKDEGPFTRRLRRCYGCSLTFNTVESADIAIGVDVTPNGETIIITAHRARDGTMTILDLLTLPKPALDAKANIPRSR